MIIFKLQKKYLGRNKNKNEKGTKVKLEADEKSKNNLGIILVINDSK